MEKSRKRLREDKDMGDVLSMLLQPDKQGDTLSDLEFKNFFALMVAAGNDTTRYSMAFSMHVLANNPYIFDCLKSSPDDAPIWSTATEEFIRWASPTMHFRRTATEDYILHNKKLEKATKLLYGLLQETMMNVSLLILLALIWREKIINILLLGREDLIPA